MAFIVMDTVPVLVMNQAPEGAAEIAISTIQAVLMIPEAISMNVAAMIPATGVRQEIVIATP